MQIDEVKGLTAIEPIFKETSISNIAIDISQSLFKSELVLFEERNDLFFEEKFFNDEDKPMNDDVIKFNMVKDYNKPLTQDLLNEINIKKITNYLKKKLRSIIICTIMKITMVQCWAKIKCI